MLPITEIQAKNATIQVFSLAAEGFDGHLVVGHCPRKGHQSRVCAARISGPQPMRLRVIVSRNKKGDYVVRARRL